MSEAVRAGRGWGLWLIFLLGLAVAPLNLLGIAWVALTSTFDGTETLWEEALLLGGLCALGLLLLLSIVGMIRRWDETVVGTNLSLIFLFPAALVLAFGIVGAD
ncbi:hypothetical protein [Brevundimonas sp.]